GPGDLFYSVLPLHHVFEATAGFLAPIYGGVTIAYSSSLRPDVMRAELRELRPTVMLVVPLILEKFLLGIRRNLSKLSPGKRLAFGVLRGVSRITDIFTGGRTTRALYKTVREQMGLDRARYMISGGAALPRWVSAGLEEMGFPILQGYGLSEASPVVSVNPPDAPRNASVGIPIQFCEVKIMNPDANRVGEIAVRAPFVMQGYYKNPEATREVITPDGWLLTGDMGYIDSDGYIYITGRKKAVIVTKGGKNIFPEEIEEKLTQSEMISEALVFGAKNPRTGEEDVQAIIYPNMELMGKMGLTDEERIYELVKKEVDAVNARLADYKKIRRFALRFEEFPKTTTVKIKRHLFKNIFIEKGQKVL
ncbi:MAG: AMP-binding protein, partial [candidate division WOR-3 bacterium]